MFLFSTVGHAQQTIVGIGIATRFEDGIIINDVIPGGPAALSGQLHPQDKIQGIGQGRNGRIEDITNMLPTDVSALIRGNKGTVVRLDVLPGGNGPSKIVELVRDEIKLPEPTPEQQLQQQIANRLRNLQSPSQRLRIEADSLNSYRSPWNDQGTWRSLNVMLRNGGESELGLSDDQKQQLSALYQSNSLSAEWHRQMRENPTPEYTQAEEALAAARIPGDPLLERATEEQKNAYREASLVQLTLFSSDMQATIQETLTPEQMLVVRKFEIQLMSEAVPFPSMFEALGLTGDQKEDMQAIADELKPEFDALTMELAKIKSDRVIAAYGLLADMSFASLEELNNARGDAFRRYVPSDEMRRRTADLQERGRKLVATLQNRLMDVLTDEQLDKMQKILDETPEFAKRILARFKAGRETQEQSPVYVPGPNSWRPGDPVPAQFKEERRRVRFSRGVEE